jgi:hypothetical protein
MLGCRKIYYVQWIHYKANYFIVGLFKMRFLKFTLTTFSICCRCIYQVHSPAAEVSILNPSYYLPHVKLVVALSANGFAAIKN